MVGLDEAIRTRRVIVCVGSGGVGKTTVAASVALKAALLGRRAVVCTIDPAKRLANALGLEELGNVEARVDDDRLRAAGLEPTGNGELWAMMLDLKRSWDEFVQRHLPPEKHETILNNRFYQTLSSALAGSQEYIALEKLYDLYDSGTYDLVVLDTPPTAQALDFLEAPNRVLDFLDNDAVRTFLGPAVAAGKVGLSLFRLGSSYVTKTISKLIGVETVQELASFLMEMQGMLGVSRDRAAKVKTLLGSDEAAFILVSSPNALTVDEAIYFFELLVKERMPVATVVANRVHLDPYRGEEPPTAPELAAMSVPFSPPEGLHERLANAVADARALAERDARHLARLIESVQPTPVIRIPRFDRDCHDIADLWKIDQHLFTGEPTAP